MTMFAAAAAGDYTAILLKLVIIIVAAKAFAEVFERLRQPAVAGEILAGVIIGPSVLGWVTPSEVIDVLAEIGVIFLLFNVGLETKPTSLVRVGRRATMVAVMGVVAPLVLGWLLMRAWGSSNIEALFIGTAMVATSVGITARVLSSLGILNTEAARVILAAAVIDDILGLLILAVVSGTAGGEVDVLKIGITALLAVGFTLFMAFVGAPVVTRAAPRVETLRVGQALFVFGLILCLGLSAAASYVGVAAIIGAFLAGMALAEVSESHPTLHLQTNGVTEFLVPFFLVNIGMQVRLDVFRNPSLVVLAVLITLLAVGTKFFACGAAAWSFGPRRAAQVGVGMVPRGEVGVVVAQLGLTMAVIGSELYGVVLFMAIATTLIAPPFIKLLFASEARAEDVTASEVAAAESGLDDIA